MLKSFVSSPVGVAVGVSLLVLLLVCGVGCAWHWNRRETTALQLTLPKFIQRRSSRHKDYTKSVGLSAYVTSPSTKTSVESKDHKSTAKRNKMHGNYENVEVGPPRTEGATEKALYENTQPSNLEEHVYGNQMDPLYYNFQKPSLPPPQDEDIYILPDCD
ncbi:protein GAPT [Grammomys surdaster]|uniref:protein GAPT n=1 Tax=Grammomys surdaster TaxID=491861 RepID=UPI00109FA530|nr:protein GAPT [Grammomys surdaster]